MSKYSALIELGWIKKWFEGNDPCEILRQVEEYQDFDCLLRMGRMEETKKGQKELSILEAFLDKYYDGTLTMEDIKKLNVHLSIGDIACHGIAETEEGIAALKTQ